MTPWKHPLFIVNPASGAGQTRARFFRMEPDLRRMFCGMDVVFTEGPLHAMRIALDAAKRGETDLLVVFGGDGTLNEVVSGLLSGEGTGRPVLAVLPGGTGGDFRRLLGLTGDLDRLKRYLVSGRPTAVDAGNLDYVAHDGTVATRYFLNIASAGISGLVDRYVNSTTKVFGGRISFLVGTLRGMFRYKNVFMRVLVDGRCFHEGPAAVVAVANGRFFGGGMMVAPKATLDDGLLDVVVLGDLSKVRFLGLSRFIYSGRHLGQPGITTTRGREVVVTAGGEALIDLDGEQVGRLPMTARVRPGAVRLLVPDWPGLLPCVLGGGETTRFDDGGRPGGRSVSCQSVGTWREKAPRVSLSEKED